jgi:hypothetical protein
MQVIEAEARVVLVDRNHQPGGHWTMAYPSVRLHQTWAFCGGNSLTLGSNTIDQVGRNEGHYEICDRRGGLRALRPRHAPAAPADCATQLLPMIEHLGREPSRPTRLTDRVTRVAIDR